MDDIAVAAGSGHDAVIELKDARGTYTRLAVETRQALAPRDAERLLPRIAQVVRRLAPSIPLLLVAPWLSSRTRGLLAEQDVNYLDLTGNALIRLENPTLFIMSAGAERNPAPAPRGRPRARGPKAARLIRCLADVRPPYGVGELAAATQLAPGYVSRLLDALDRDALVERSHRGRVEGVAVADLLRRWSESYDVLRSNRAKGFVAPNGASDVARGLVATNGRARVAITGSFAAVRHAPVAAPAVLMAYCEDMQQVARALGLIPADRGADVVLLQPFDPVAWERLESDGDLRYAAPSQVVVDCLTGTGRMPAEGEALLSWLGEHERRWRSDRLSDAGSS